jgi:hypothetical protein
MARSYDLRRQPDEAYMTSEQDKAKPRLRRGEGTAVGQEALTAPACYDFLREVIQIVIGSELVDIQPMELLPDSPLA